MSYDADLSVVSGNVVTVESNNYRGIYINPKPSTNPVSYVYVNVCEKLSAVGVENATEKSVVAYNIIRKSGTIASTFTNVGNIIAGNVPV